MSLRRLPIALALGAALIPALPSVAAADAPWSAPTPIPGAGGQTAPLVVTRAGHGVLLAGADRSGAAPAGAASELVPLDPDGRPSGPAHGLKIAAAKLVTYASDRVVVAGSTLDARGTISDRSHVQVAFGSASGALGTLRGLTGSTGQDVRALAANKAGDAVLVTGNTRKRQVWLRRHGGASTFKVALTIPVSSTARGVTAAVGATGDVLVVWEDQHHVFARHIGPTGGLGRTTHVGDGVQSHLQAAVGADRRLSVAWVSQRVSEGEANTPAEGFFATAAPGHGFGAARQIATVGAAGTGRAVADPAVRLVVGDDGTTDLAWTSFAPDTSHFTVSATAVAGGHVGTPRVVSDPQRDTVLGDLAVGPKGTEAILIRAGIAGADPDGTPMAVQAAVSAGPGQAFGAPETITGPDTQVLVAPTVAVDPAHGGALAAIPFLSQQASGLSVAARAPIAG